MVGVLLWGKHGRAAPPERLVGFAGVRLGLAKVSLAQAPCRTHSQATAVYHECEGRAKLRQPCSQGPRGRPCGHGGRFPSCACTPSPSRRHWPHAPGPWGGRHWAEVCHEPWAIVSSTPRCRCQVRQPGETTFSLDNNRTVIGSPLLGDPNAPSNGGILVDGFHQTLNCFFHT